MKIRVELTESDLRQLIIAHLAQRYGDSFDIKKLKIQTRSKQNYKSEWETAEYKAIYESED